MYRLIRTVSLFSLLLPRFAFAQNLTFSSLVDSLVGLINTIVPVLIGLSLLAVIFGVLKMMIRADNKEERKKGKDRIIYGIIGLFVIVSVWGLVNFVRETLGF